MVTRVFRAHGEFCASHPWEVIVAILTLTACVLTVDQKPAEVPTDTSRQCDMKENCLGFDEYNAADVIVMTIIRCIAVLYCYYQFCHLHKLGSKYILGIAGLFTVFSSFVFSSSVINLLSSDISDLKDALFFFLLLIDLSKATLLAQFALSSRSHDEVKQNIARGIAVLGPTISLDTLVETLVIGVGTLSGVRRLEVLCCFACMSVIVNYMVFMTFYPACLSLILELSHSSGGEHPKWHDKSLILLALKEEDQKPNPVVQRVKVIMSAGLMLVHAHSRWSFVSEGEDGVTPLVEKEHSMISNHTEDAVLHNYIMKWLTVSADHIVILILLLALTVKFILFEDRQDRTGHLLMAEKELQEMRRQTSAGVTEDSEESSGVCANIVKNMGGWIEIGPGEGQVPAVLEDKEVQTEDKMLSSSEITPQPDEEREPRSVEECLTIYKSKCGAESLTDNEVISLVHAGHIPSYQLEKAVNDPERGVSIRRQIVAKAGNFTTALVDLPYQNYDYSKVMGACCENVIGYMPVPVGLAGPLHLDGQLVYVPMATTEGCLVASTNRGCRALLEGGVVSRVVADGMTRGPVVRFPSAQRASEAMAWMELLENFENLKESFDSTSSFAKLKKIQVRPAGRSLFIRFIAITGDAMGMNMVSKGTEVALRCLQEKFPEMEILSLSGNFCTDKKAAAVNWIEGRGKSVVCEAIVPAKTVKNVLKTSVNALVELNILKNLVGSAMAGSIGGFNAHAANVVTAVFIATGQDPAQNVESSNCITLMEPWGKDGEDLYITVTMPSIEVGTVGGGTVLPAQGACLEMLGVKGANEQSPGENAKTLARIVCGAVLAGELSLMSALAEGHLVRSHLRHNRSSTAVKGLTVRDAGAPCMSSSGGNQLTVFKSTES